MSHMHVCLISEQTIPNILSIYHFNPNEVLFISTDRMEKLGKTRAIINTLERLGIKSRYNKICVDENSILDCYRKIDEWIKGKEDSDFVVNLTCGTKLMAIAAYEYFKNFSSKMIYIPLPKNEFIEPFPIKKPSIPSPLSLKLKVIDYLTAYGHEVINERKLKNYSDQALGRRELTCWIIENYDNLKSILAELFNKLRAHRNDKKYEFNEKFHNLAKIEIDFFERFGFIKNKAPCQSEIEIRYLISDSEIRYLTGGWLEEYAFLCMYELMGKRLIDDVVLNIKLRNPNGGDNEFDVMFTKDNSLYFIECKSLDPEDEVNINALYKIGALQKEFGLRVESFYVTTSSSILTENGELRPSIQARAEQFKTEIILPEQVRRLKEIIAGNLI